MISQGNITKECFFAGNAKYTGRQDGDILTLASFVGKSCAGGVQWNRTVDKLEGCRQEENRGQSSLGHGHEKVGDLRSDRAAAPDQAPRMNDQYDWCRLAQIHMKMFGISGVNAHDWMLD